MISLLAIAVAVVLAAVPIAVSPVPPVGAVAAIGVLMAAVATAARWRWLAAAAACVFLVDYAAALWLAPRASSPLGAAGFGLALLALLEAVDLRCRARRGAAVAPVVVLAQAGGWLALGAWALAGAALAVGLARAVAVALPPAVAPLVAAAGALGSLLLLALVIVRAARHRAGG